MRSRRSTSVLILLILASLCFSVTFADAIRLRRLHVSAIEIKRDLVASLQLTDLSLFTEARYTRHPSQADLFSALMDHPFALEHFPSGSLISPPSHLTDTDETLAR